MLDEAKGPEAYAKGLARYISDPSTIRVRTLNAYGRAPSIEKCREYRAKFLAKQSPADRRFGSIAAPEYFKRCGHEKVEENCYYSLNGVRLCLCCQREREAAAALVREANKRPAPPAPVTRVKTDPRKAKLADVPALIDAAAQRFAIEPGDILGSQRAVRFTDARCAVAVVLRGRGYSYPQIGRAMSCDHSSIAYLVKTSRARMKRNPAIRSAVKELAA